MTPNCVRNIPKLHLHELDDVRKCNSADMKQSGKHGILTDYHETRYEYPMTHTKVYLDPF